MASGLSVPAMRRIVGPKKQAEISEVADFLHWLYVKAEFPSWAEWAKQANLLPSTISDYQRAMNAPNGYNLLKLIRAAERRKLGSSEAAVVSSDPYLSQVMQVIETLRDVEALRASQGSSEPLGGDDDPEAEIELLEARLVELRRRRVERKAS